MSRPNNTHNTMITREQFEAHVRAEAEKKHPIQVGMPLTYRIMDDAKQRAYIAARMEHEWPLVKALTFYSSTKGPDNVARQALSKYTNQL